MVFKAADLTVTTAAGLYGGVGEVELKHILYGAEAGQSVKIKMYAFETVPAGASIGMHTHADTSEVLYFLSGSAQYFDGDEQTRVEAGCKAVCPLGGKHAVVNDTDEPLYYMMLVLEHI